ncbi:MAG: hypothetical protein ACQ5SW_03275 [Sphaerochaetaceae bacterium]
MKRWIMLLFSLGLLFAATILMVSLFFPRVTFLVDAPYSRTVLAVQKHSLFFSLLKGGYLLDVEVVPLSLEGAQMMEYCHAKSRFIVASPLVSTILGESNIFSHVVAQGKNTQYASFFDGFWIIDETDMIGKQPTTDFLTALVGEGTDEYYAEGFPSDLVLLKASGEDDHTFASRVQQVLNERNVFAIVVPSPGTWAISLLEDSSLQWVVTAEYLPLVPVAQRYAVIAPDLVEAIEKVLSGQRGIQRLVWKTFKL